MPVYRPSELKNFLIENGVNPKKALSQNFLIDGNILKKIIVAAEVKQKELILEIGPGPGALTEQLLMSGANIIAVEKDVELFHLLPRLNALNGKLQAYHDDIIRFPIEKTLSEALKNGEKAKVIANLPYHLTTPILEKIVPMHHIFSKIVVMVQDEVAKRFTARPGTSDYGSFTIFLNYYSKPHYAFQVKKTSFHPSPKVDSAIVVLDLCPPRTVSHQEKFFEMTRTAFQKRRKMLRTSLSELYDKDCIVQTLEKLSLNPQIRPEELSIESFIQIFENLYQTQLSRSLNL